MQHIRGLFKQESFEKKQVNIREMLSEAVRFLHGDPRKHDVPIDWQLDEHLPTVSVDLTQIQQVFINLISNAVEALEGSHISPHIIVRASATDQNQVLIQVTDNAPGVPIRKESLMLLLLRRKMQWGLVWPYRFPSSKPTAVGSGPRITQLAVRHSAWPYHFRPGNRNPVRVTVRRILTRGIVGAPIP
jgi:hypothetical protein